VREARPHAVGARDREDVHHLEFRITGCCADLINKAMDQVRQPDPKDWWKTGRSPLD
jgi:hypothetical protein